jgi:autotransporter-associated beta strand protein
VTLAGGLNGAGGITENTTGFITVSGGGSYDGNTVINGGTFYPNSPTAFGSTIGSTTVNAGGSIFSVQTNTYNNESVTINGTGTVTGSNPNNDGALHAGGPAISTFDGPITVASNSLINVDGGSTLSLTNTTGPTGSNVTLTVSGPGTLSIRGAPNLGATGSIVLAASGANPAGNLAFAPLAGETPTISTPITGTGSITINTGGTPTQATLGTTTLVGSPVVNGVNQFSGPITVNTGILRIQSADVLGTATATANTLIVGSTNATNIVGTLQLAPTSGNLSIAEPLNVGARQGNGIDVPHVENISGNNTLTGAITASTGGSDYNFQSDAGSLTVQSNFSTAGLASARNLKLQGAGNGTWSGVLSDNATAPLTLVKNGTGTWTLSGANTYTGATTVNGGTLTLGVANSISTTSLVTLNGGTLGTGGLSQNITLGTTPAPLNVTLNSAIDLGSGSSTLTFADSSGQSWSGNLNVVHWNSGPDHLIFGNSSSALSGTQLIQITFATYQGPAVISASGEVTPSSLTRILTHGDWSLDGVLNLADISAALTALTDLNKYMSDNGLTSGQLATIGDYDSSGTVTNRDIQGLLNDVAAHGGGSLASVPEPGSIALLLIGLAAGVPLVRASRRRMKLDRI